MSDEKVINNNSKVPCFICGNPAPDYAAQVGIFYPNQSEFLCIDCYKRWKDGEFADMEFRSKNGIGAGKVGNIMNNPTRHNKTEKDSQGKLQCHYCKQWKDDWEITIDESKIARLICEDCLSERKCWNF